MMAHDRMHLGLLTANQRPRCRVLTNQGLSTNTRQYFLVTGISSWTHDQGQCQEVFAIENIASSSS